MKYSEVITVRAVVIQNKHVNRVCIIVTFTKGSHSIGDNREPAEVQADSYPGVKSLEMNTLGLTGDFVPLGKISVVWPLWFSFKAL